MGFMAIVAPLFSLVLGLNILALILLGVQFLYAPPPARLILGMYIFMAVLVLGYIYCLYGRSRKRSNRLEFTKHPFLRTIDLEELYHAAPAGDLLLTEEGMVLDYNRPFERNFLGSYNLERNSSFYNMIAEGDRETFKRTLARVFQSNNVESIEFRFEWEGEAIAYVGVFKPKEGDVFDKRFFFIQIFDNSEQKSVQLRLVQSQKTQAMGQLAGGIAHDFNNLLTAMIGFCDLLLLRHTPGDQSFTDIMQIKQNANRAANLVRQLLAFSRQQTLQPRIMDITESLADLSILLQRLIGAGISLKIHHGKELGLVRVDQGQFEQVIINLAVNARDAIAGNGEILIKTENKIFKRPVALEHDTIPAGSYVLIQVIDNGCGIPPQYRDRIFDPFFSTKEIGSGTGLGLATVQGIVTQTGGHIDVDSEVGIGTKFSIYLPIYDGLLEETPTLQEKQISHKDLTGSGVILIVEDEDAVRVFSARALRDKGYHVVEASNGEEGLYVLKDLMAKGTPPDLLITDVVMPVKDGPTLALEATGLLPQLKVIFMSGYAEDSFRQNLHQNEALHFIAKPFNLKAMAQKVKEVLEEQRSKTTHKMQSFLL